MGVRLTCGAHVAAAASEGGEGRGHERRAGWLLGLREFVGRPTCGRARALGRRERLAGRLGYLADTGRAAGWEAYFFFSFFYFFFILFIFCPN